MKKGTIIRFFIAAFVFLVAADTANAQQKKLPTAQLPAKQVCMINNKFMSKDQIAVPVNGKTYYGCCEMCVTNLKSNEASRVASDPLTKQKVDKAQAYIIVKPGSTDDVLYFASKANAVKYTNK